MSSASSSSLASEKSLGDGIKTDLDALIYFLLLLFFDPLLNMELNLSFLLLAFLRNIDMPFLD